MVFEGTIPNPLVVFDVYYKVVLTKCFELVDEKRALRPSTVWATLSSQITRGVTWWGAQLCFQTRVQTCNVAFRRNSSIKNKLNPSNPHELYQKKPNHFQCFEWVSDVLGPVFSCSTKEMLSCCRTGQVDVVITGADRVTRRGDACNKIGTYLKALSPVFGFTLCTLM